MKTNVINYIYDDFHERGQKAFELRLKRLFKSHGIVGEVICHNAWMERVICGGYYDTIELQIEGRFYDGIRTYHTDSQRWDYWDYPTAKQKRQLFEAVVLDNIDDIADTYKWEMSID